MINVILLVLVLLVVILCVSSILWHYRQGELCDCPGDCENCRIQCRSNVKYYGTAAQTMPVMTEKAKKHIRAESRISLVLRKLREALDFICYWLFNLCAIAAMIRGLVIELTKLFG